jgi:hypothetical protein
MELRLATAKEIVGYKEAQFGWLSGLWGGQQQAEPQAQAPQFENIQQMGQQLDKAWKAFAQLYNQQVRPLNEAYKHIIHIVKSLSSPETSKHMNLTGGIANQVQSLISTLQQAVNDENSDTQMLQNIGMAASGIAQAMGMRGVGQTDPETGQQIGEATPADNAALGEMAQRVEQEQQVAQPTEPETYNLAPPVQLPSREPTTAPTTQPAGTNLGEAAPVEEVPQPIAAEPKAPQTPQVGRKYLRNKAQGRPLWIQERMQQGVDEATAAQEYDTAFAHETARKSKYRKQPPVTPATASASAFVKV